jgi:hypothetical protein
MTKVIWLGDGSADENEWNGVVFRKGEAVDVTDEQMLKTARYNPFFKVAGEKAKGDDAPSAPNPMGRPDDIPENAAFASQEQLDARHEASQQLAEQDDEEKRGPGRPRKS